MFRAMKKVSPERSLYDKYPCKFSFVLCFSATQFENVVFPSVDDPVS